MTSETRKTRLDLPPRQLPGHGGTASGATRKVKALAKQIAVRSRHAEISRVTARNWLGSHPTHHAGPLVI
jgi:hypothetical protein